MRSDFPDDAVGRTVWRQWESITARATRAATSVGLSHDPGGSVRGDNRPAPRAATTTLCPPLRTANVEWAREVWGPRCDRTRGAKVLRRQRYLDVSVLGPQRRWWQPRVSPSRRKSCGCTMRAWVLTRTRLAGAEERCAGPCADPRSSAHPPDGVAKAAALLSCPWAVVAVAHTSTDKPARLAASTDEDLAARIAGIAGAAGASPEITAFESGQVVVCPDLAVTDEYPDYCNGILAETPVRSVRSVLPSRWPGSWATSRCWPSRRRSERTRPQPADRAPTITHHQRSHRDPDGAKTTHPRRRLQAIGQSQSTHQHQARRSGRGEPVETGNLPDLP